jgi:hypothetical protein
MLNFHRNSDDQLGSLSPLFKRWRGLRLPLFRRRWFFSWTHEGRCDYQRDEAMMEMHGEEA